MILQFLYFIHSLAPFFALALKVIKAWWWLPLPFILWKPLSFYWLWWKNDKWDETFKRILLEIRIPKESLKPIRAMETVLSGLWQLYAPPNWYETWWEGKYPLSFSLEIVAIDGIPHFFIRIPESFRNVTESHIYSQYPEAEISLVDDYTQYVPQDVPNKEWEIWGTDYHLTKPDAYPIRTYTQFETERETEEEKRIDPISSLLEAMSKLQPGEQLWVQIRACPVLDEIPWKKKGEEIRDKLINRKAPPAPKPIIPQVIDLLFRAKVPGGAPEKEEAFLPPEMKLTPGEKDIVYAIEKKIGKLGFKTFVRYIYLAKRDVYFGGNNRLAMSYFTNFVTENLNGIVPWGETITKVKQNWYDWFLFVKRRLYLKKRRIFRNYVLRVNPLFPRAGGTFILNTEELASIYHFPSRTVAAAPLVPRVEAKKGEAPPGLPVE